MDSFDFIQIEDSIECYLADCMEECMEEIEQEEQDNDNGNN